MRKFCLALVILLVACSTNYYSSKHKEKAIKYHKEKKYALAIKEYKNHINARLNSKSRESWENPYIYYLDIGDIYLEQGEEQKALQAYLYAESNGVQKTFIDDRLKLIAYHYEKNKQYEKAIEHLKKYRERDPLIFDLILDRLAKKYIYSSDAK